MRVLALILMTLSFIVGGACAGILFKNIENRMGGTDYSVVDELQAQIDELTKSGIDVTTIDDPELQESLDVLNNMPPKWKVQTAGPLGIVLAVCGLIMVVIAYMKKSVIKIVSVAVVLLALALWIITPNIEAGLFSGANPKSIAFIALIGLTISSLFAFLSFTFAKKKVA